MDDIYSFSVVERFLINLELAEAFLHRVTEDVVEKKYQSSREIDPKFFVEEGHTMWDGSPGGTRVPKRSGLRETILNLKADFDYARSMVLDDGQDLVLMFFYTTTPFDYNETTDQYTPTTNEHLASQAQDYLVAVVRYMNGEEAWT